MHTQNIARIFTKYKYQWIVAIKRFTLARNQIIKEREKLLAGICRHFKILILICKYQPGESWVELSSCWWYVHQGKQFADEHREIYYSILFLPGEAHGRGAWWATVHGVAKSKKGLKWLSTHVHEQRNRDLYLLFSRIILLQEVSSKEIIRNVDNINA